jgi:hypothetical protein
VERELVGTGEREEMSLSTLFSVTLEYGEEQGKR